MATHRIPVFSANNLPDSSSDVFWRPASVGGTNNFYNPLILVFNDTAAKDSCYLAHTVPKNYASGAKYVVKWRTQATSGAWECDIDYTSLGAGETSDPAAAQRSLNEADTAGGSTDLLQEFSLTATDGDYAVDDLVLVKLSRDGTDAGDTLADVVEVWKIEFEYAD